MKKPSEIREFRGMDLDSPGDTIDARSGMYREGRNMRIYPKGRLTSMDGMTEIFWDMPVGANECVGEHWDAETDTTFLFIWNSLGNHSIIRLFANDLSVHVVAQGDIFDFRRDKVVSGKDFVFNQFLFWVESGHNDPRQLDVNRADDTDKKRVYRVYFPQSPNVVDQRIFSCTVTDPQGVPVSGFPAFHVSGASEVFSFNLMISEWCDSFNANFGTYFTAQSCGNFAEVTAVLTGGWRVVLNYTDTIGGLLQPSVLMKQEFRNGYERPFVREQIDLAMFHPLNPPEVSVFTDPTRSDNRIERKVFQFALRYVYRSNGRSVEGPWTDIVSVAPSVFGAASTGNAILVDFSNDQNLLSTKAFDEVEQVEIFVKELNGLWKSATILDKWEFAYSKTWVFRNDSQLIAYQGISGNIREPFPFNPYTSVPQRAFAQAVVADPNNKENIRMIQSGIVEGLPAPCLPVDIDLGFSETTIAGYKTCRVRVQVKIANPTSLNGGYNSDYTRGTAFNQLIHCPNPSESDPTLRYVFGGFDTVGLIWGYKEPQNYNQYIPLGGFAVYLAGTGYYAVTQQVFRITAALGSPAYNAAASLLNFLSFIQGTTIPDSSTASKRGRIRDVMVCPDIDIVQEGYITGVKTGQSYILRIAEHRCYTIGDGSMYDLSGTSLKWQRTSTQTIGCGVNPPVGFAPYVDGGFFEARIDIDQNQLGIFDSGFCAVADCAGVDQFLSPRVLIRNYCFDLNGIGTGPGADIRDLGTPVELQAVASNQPQGASVSVSYIAASGFGYVSMLSNGSGVTDHNGHVFFYSVGTGTQRVEWTTNSGNPLLPAATRTANEFAGGGSSGSSKYQGNLVGALGATTIDNLAFTNSIAEYIVPNLLPAADSPSDSMRTHVEGYVVDQLNQPLSGILVIIEGGKYTTTDVNGFYSIPVYADVSNNLNRRILSGLIVFSGGFVNIQWVQLYGYFPPAYLNIYQFNEFGDYSNYSPFLFDSDLVSSGIQPIYAILPTSATLGAVWPRGWRGAIGVVLYDQHARVSPVQKLKEIYIPWQTEDLHKTNPVRYPVAGTYEYGLPEILFSILGDVPVPENGRYVRYEFVATRNTLYRFMLQWAVPFIMYISEYDEGNGPVPTSPSSGTATEILLYMNPSFQRYRELHADTADYVGGDFVQSTQVGYEWQSGDRLIILSDRFQSFIPFVDVVIIGQRGDAIVIKADTNVPILYGGEVVVIYRPSVEDQDEGGREYFGIPGASFEIIDPFGNPQWSSVSGIVSGGDSYVIGSQIPIRPGFNPLTVPPPATPWTLININRQSTSISDFYQSDVVSLGRRHFEDSLAKTELIPTRNRFTDPWVKGSGLNGLFTFNIGDFRDANPRHGIVRSLVSFSDRVVAFCEASMSFSMYIGTVTSRAQDGVLSAATNAFIAQVYDFAVEYGTVNPESVRKYKTWAFAFDYNKGVVFRYSVNGLDEMKGSGQDPTLTYGVSITLSDLARDYDGLELPRIPIGVFERYDEVWLTFNPRTKVQNGIDIEVGNLTLTYHDGSKVWVSKVDAVPEIYSRTRSLMLSMKGGRIYMNDADPANACNFFGQSFPYGMTVVENVEAKVEKIWQACGVTGSGGYQFTTFDAGNGQVSSSPLTRRINGTDYADRGILPDSQGEKLRSKTLTIEINNTSGDPGFIQGVVTRWNPVYPMP